MTPKLKPGRHQAKEITDLDMLLAVKWGHEIQLPPNVIRAKERKLVHRGLLARWNGRLELTDAGRLVYRQLIRNRFSGGTGTRPLGPT